MAATIRQIMDIVEEIAPESLREDYDNTGLLAGHPDWETESVLVALDLTENVVEEAVRAGSRLIVTHHPIFFRGRKNIREDDPEGAAVCALVRAGIGLIAAHTNFDNAPCGVNDALAEALGLEGVIRVTDGMRMGDVRPAVAACDAGKWVEEKLGGRTRVYASDPGVLLERIAVCGGSGGDFWKDALNAGAQAFVTGEISYHKAIEAAMQGLCVLEAGHYETEHIAIKLLADGLQSRINELQYKVNVKESTGAPFWRFEV